MSEEIFSGMIHINDLVDDQFCIQKDLLDRYTRQNQLLVINCSMDPFNNAVYDFCNQILQLRYHSDFLILSPDVHDPSSQNDNIVYYPYWFLFLRKKHEPHPKTTISNSIRRYKISCLNGRARPHRIENFMKARKKIWFNQMLFSFHNAFCADTEQKEQPGLTFANEHILPEFLELLSTLPARMPVRIPHDNNFTFDPAYTDTYINFVTETGVHENELFISEKAFKPLLAGQFGIWLGSPGLVSYLRFIGFDVFDDYIDHRYDNEPNWHRRIDMIHCQIEQLLNLDFEKIFIDTSSRRLYNQQHFYSDTLFQSLTNNLQERMGT